jgi:PAS domain S-box-containing protein
MKLRTKAILILLATFIPLLLFFYFSIRAIVLREHEELEVQTVRQNVQRALNSIRDEMEAISTINHDWSSWDDTYQFVIHTNQTYIDSNLMDETFVGLQVNLMAFLNQKHQYVYTHVFDLHEKTTVPFPPTWTNSLQDICHLLDDVYKTNDLSGFLNLPDGPLILNVRPILTSVNEGPSHGCLVMGRILDQSRIERFCKITALDLTLVSPSAENLSPDLQQAGQQLFQLRKTTLPDHPIDWVQPLNAETIAGYTLLDDIFGNPFLMLRLTMPRSIYQSAQSALNYVLLSLLGIGLVFGLLILHLWQQNVLSRLTQLSERVERIGTIGDLSEQMEISGRDELSSLGRSFNHMLKALNISSKALQDSERQYRSFVQNFQGIAFRYDLTGQLLFIHGALERITGYQEKELMNGVRHWEDLIDTGDRPLILDFIKRGCSTPGLKQERQYRIIRKDGTTRWIYEMLQNVTDEQGKPIYVQSTAYDITERRQAELDLQRSRDELARLSSHLQEIREEERTRIARQIHDNLGQLLMALNIEVSSMVKKMSSNPGEAIQRAQSARELVDRILDTVQTISLELRPSVLESLGITDALEWQVNEFKKLTGITCELNIEPPDLSVSKALQTTVFRVTQEALNNVARHAEANRVDIRLESKNSQLILVIHDNGKGISAEAIRSLNSFGLIQMKERALSHNGGFSIEGAPGQGTTLRLTLALFPEQNTKVIS